MKAWVLMWLFLGGGTKDLYVLQYIGNIFFF